MVREHLGKQSLVQEEMRREQTRQIWSELSANRWSEAQCSAAPCVS